MPDASLDPPAVSRDPDAPADAIGVALSGGGVRAEVFHVGALRRLNELGVLGRVACFSSVSGGSITNAALGLRWRRLRWEDGPWGPVATNFDDELTAPVRAMARVSIDVGSVVWGTVNPFRSVADEVADAYAKHLFGDATLQDWPDEPEFVVNATNVKTGTLWRFSKRRMGDWMTGLVLKPTVKLATAVAASSAFPPFLSPVRLAVGAAAFDPATEAIHATREYRDEIVLSDGGVYDNLGLEPIFKNFLTVFVSDGGRAMAPDPRPAGDWARHSRRLIDLLERQVSSLRKRQIVDAYVAGTRKGAYWGVGTDVRRYGLATAFAVPPIAGRATGTPEVANYPTRLDAMPDDVQEKLINWGYAVCDAAVRRHHFDGRILPRPDRLPYPGAGL